MIANGSNPTRLTTNPAYDLDPAFSPDGTRVAFTRFVAFPIFPHYPIISLPMNLGIYTMKS